MGLGGATVLAIATWCTAEALRSSSSVRMLAEVAEEEQVALRTFASAAPFVVGVASDVTRLQRYLRQAESFLQVNVEPVKKAAIPKATSAATTAAAAGKDVDSAAVLKSMSNMGVEAMPAMLGMMEGMYSSWKGKISAANKKEQEEKKSFDEQISDLDKKKLQYKGDANATKTYDFIEKYWTRQREISHRQYHTTLKLMHSGMQKFKTMIGAYKGVLAGKKPTQQQMAAVGALIPPEVVLLQMQVKELTVWADGASAILRDARHLHPGTHKAGQLPVRS